MPFLKNLQFTHLIKINGQLKEFNFRKSNANIETVITVDTCDEKHNRLRFNMHRSGNEWKFNEANLPTWIHENESGISEVILKEFASQQMYLVAPGQHSHWHLDRLRHAFGFN